MEGGGGKRGEVDAALGEGQRDGVGPGSGVRWAGGLGWRA